MTARRRKSATPFDTFHPTPVTLQLSPAPFVERRNPARREALRRRVRAEFEEMPGLHLNFWQATRLFGMNEGVCDRVLAELIAEGVLCRRSNGAYARREIES
jgi:hypothetical protein